MSAAVSDWAGGTRIGACLAEFNHRWSRRLPEPVVAMASGWMRVRQRAKAHVKGVRAKRKMRKRRSARGLHPASKKRRTRAAKRKRK